MWRIPLSFIILLIIVYVCERLGDHLNISQGGGIRKRYNKVFSYLFRLPYSRISIETKSYVKFNVSTNRYNMIFTLNYNNDSLDIKSSVTFKDDTPFNNGETKKWNINKFTNENEVLQRMADYINKLPITHKD